MNRIEPFNIRRHAGGGDARDDLLRGRSARDHCATATGRAAP